MRAAWIWGPALVAYGAFALWYSNLAGPLTADEVDLYVGRMRERGSDEQTIVRLRKFLEEDTGDDFVMVNLIEYREPPRQVGDVNPGETANEVLARYMEYMWPALLSRACHPVAGGSAAMKALEVWGVENGETWSSAAYMRYRSRRDLMEIATNPAFQGRHEYKIAAMLKTIAFPIDPWFHLGDPRLLLGLLLLVLALALHLAFIRRKAAARS